jgi:hypothetical protein
MAGYSSASWRVAWSLSSPWRVEATRHAKVETGRAVSTEGAGAVTSGFKDAAPARHAALAKESAPAKTCQRGTPRWPRGLAPPAMTSLI